jgi:NTP pyrophosphatase (non-canonical NTP hydrolase)
MAELSVRKIQKRIWKNKLDKGFNIKDIGKDFLGLTEELGEAIRAYRKNNKDELAEEISDIVIYSFGLYEILKKDAYTELIKKIEKNEKREYSGRRGSYRHLRTDQK